MSTADARSVPLSALDDNFLDANRLFVVDAKRGEYCERRDVAIACCGLPAETLNWGFLKPPYPDLAATAASVQAYFTERKLLFSLMFRDAEPQRILAPLSALGWRRREDPTPGMTLALPAAIPAVAAPLSIERVRTASQFAAFRETAFRGFGFPPTIAHLFLPDRMLAMSQVRMFAGLVAGEVVATSLMIATGSVAGIYWVATLEGHRGRGHGAALTWAAAGAGSEFGCTLASLQASKQGRPVYARMGFAHVLDYEHLLPPET
jgi:GNAT superfamily N-acetyltransferase